MFRTHIVFALLSLPLPLAAKAQTAQHGCAAAQTARERAICSSATLADAEAQLATAFRTAMQELSPPAAAAVRADQLLWLTWIDRLCVTDPKDSDSLPRCLEQKDADRTRALTQGRPVLNGIQLYTRALYVYVPATTPVDPNNPVSALHRFGYGTFAWPQIDRPSNDQALWNKAVEAAAVRIEGARGKHLAPNLKASVDADGYRSGDFHLNAGNDRLIGVTFSLSSFGWGAAHGTADQTTFLWWLDRRREVVTSDVFAPGYDWHTALLAPVRTALRTSRPGPSDLWNDPNELDSGILRGLKDPSNWTLSQTGITITFGEYGVGPYSSGMPAATLPWGSLAGHLAPGLHPETLPLPQPDAD